MRDNKTETIAHLEGLHFPYLSIKVLLFHYQYTKNDFNYDNEKS